MGAEKLELAAVLDLNRGLTSGQELLAQQEQEIAETRTVIRKFPDAVKGSRWESAMVTYENAKHYDVDAGPAGFVFDMYVEVKPLNQEPVRVYGLSNYRLTPQHMAEFAHRNPKLLIKQMSRIFKIQ